MRLPACYGSRDPPPRQPESKTKPASPKPSFGGDRQVTKPNVPPVNLKDAQNWQNAQNQQRGG